MSIFHLFVGLLCLVGAIADPVKSLRGANERFLQTIDYTLINSILATLELELETGDIEPIESSQFGATIFANVGAIATISGLGVGEISITGTLVNPTTYELELSVSGVEFDAVVGLVLTCSGLICGTLDLEDDGTLTVSSTSTSGSEVALKLTVIGDNFLANPPTSISIPSSTCQDKVDFDGIVFDVNGVGVINLPFSTQNLDLIVEEELVNDPDSAIVPIENAVCDAVDPILTLAVGLLTNLTSQVLELFPAQSIADAVATEEALVASLPEGTSLYDLNASLVELFPQLAFPSGLVVDEQNVVVQAIASALGITLEGNGLVVDVLNSLFGLDIPANAENIDVVAIVADQLNLTKAELIDFLQIDFGFAGIGNFSVAAVDIGLLVSNLPADFLVTTPAQNTVAASAGLGSISASGTVKIDAALSFEPYFAGVVISEELTLAGSITGIQGALAGLFPFEDGTLPTIDLTALFSEIIGCLLTYFYEDPSVTAVVLSVDAASLSITGAEEAILAIVQQAVNAVFPVIIGLIITVGEGAAVFGLNEAIKYGLGLVTRGCPE